MLGHASLGLPVTHTTSWLPKWREILPRQKGSCGIFDCNLILAWYRAFSAAFVLGPCCTGPLSAQVTDIADLDRIRARLANAQAQAAAPSRERGNAAEIPDTAPFSETKTLLHTFDISFFTQLLKEEQLGLDDEKVARRTTPRIYWLHAMLQLTPMN
jgi:hypothetical protein